MKKALGLTLLAAAALAPLTGCSYVGSAQGGLTPATGEAWYTKDKYIPILQLTYDSSVYYCKKDSDQCQKAEYHQMEEYCHQLHHRAGGVSRIHLLQIPQAAPIQDLPVDQDEQDSDQEKHYITASVHSVTPQNRASPRYGPLP